MFKRKIFLIILSASLAIGFSTPARALWLSGYEYRKEITIDHIKIGSDLSNFPLAVILSDTTNIIDGNDVKFTLSDGETKLDYEKEKYATDDAAYWVNIPSVSSGTDTTFYMYYGKTGDTDESTSDIWDSDYKMVQHLEEGGTGTRYDSTANNNDGSPQNYDGDEAVVGKIDGADSLDGTDDYVDITNVLDDLNSSTAGTWEFWAKPDDATDESYFIGFGDTGVNELIGIKFRPWSSVVAQENVAGSNQWQLETDNPVLTTDEWTHIVLVHDGVEPSIYIDGVKVAQTFNAESDKTAWFSDATGLDNGRIGHKFTSPSDEYFNGTFDEVRVSDVARSADWIEASYYSGNNDLLIFGSEESGVIPEPASLLLLGFGVAGLALFRKRVV